MQVSKLCRSKDPFQFSSADDRLLRSRNCSWRSANTPPYRTTIWEWMRGNPDLKPLKTLLVVTAICGLNCAHASDFDGVKFVNNYRDSLNVEVRVGKPLATGNDCEDNEELVTRRLAPGASVTVSCGKTFGAFCVKTIDKYGTVRGWDGTYTCAGHTAFSKSRIKEYDLR